MSSGHIEVSTHVHQLISKASKAGNGPEAMQFAQAALSVAHAASMLAEVLTKYPGLQKAE